MEVSRARDRFVLVTDNRERLEEVLEANDGSRMTALEAVGEEEDPPPGAPAAALAMLRELEADWRTARLACGGRGPGAHPHGRLCPHRDRHGNAGGEPMELPADLRAFVEEVRSRDAQAIAERRQRVRVLAQGGDALPQLASPKMGGGEARASVSARFRSMRPG